MCIKTRIVLHTFTLVNVANGSFILATVYFSSPWRYQFEIFTVCPRTQKLNFPRFLRASDRLSSCYICFPITFGIPLVQVILITYFSGFATGRFLEKCISSYGGKKQIFCLKYSYFSKIWLLQKIKRSFFIGHKIPFHRSTNGKDDILSSASSEVRNSMLWLLYDKRWYFLNIFSVRWIFS